MPINQSPVQLVQNPAFGSLLLWKFGTAYQEQSVGRLPNFELFFLVLPLVLHKKTLTDITSTMQGSGLGKFVSKMSENREDILAVHDRALALRLLTLQSVSVGLSTKLLAINYESGDVRANDAKPPRQPDRLKTALTGAEKLGKWFARVPANQAFSLLQVYP